MGSAREGFFALQERNRVYVYLQLTMVGSTHTFHNISPFTAIYPPLHSHHQHRDIHRYCPSLPLLHTCIWQRGRTLRIERTPYMGRGHLTENLGYESPGPSINLKGTFADDQCGVQAKPASRPPSATFAKCRRF